MSESKKRELELLIQYLQVLADVADATDQVNALLSQSMEKTIVRVNELFFYTPN